MFPPDPRSIPEEAMYRNFKVHKRHLHDVVTERDTAFSIDIGRSKDDQCIILSHQSILTSEVSVIPIPFAMPDWTDKLSTIQPIILTPRQKGLKYYVDHARGHFIVATNTPYHPPLTLPSSSSKSSPSFSSSSSSPTSSSSKSSEALHGNTERDSDLWIIRCPTATALRATQSSNIIMPPTPPLLPPSNGRIKSRIKKKVLQPHPFLDWEDRKSVV